MSTPAPGTPHFRYCRPHPKFITADMQFVVRTCRGIDLGDRVIPEGEEFPAHAVNEYWLKCLYEQLQIELMPEDHPAYKHHAQSEPEEAPAKKRSRGNN